MYNQSCRISRGPDSPPNEELDSERIAKHVLDHLMPLAEIIGVQPMSGPVGLVFFMRYFTSEEKTVDSITHMTLEIQSAPVEAYSRKLMSKFSPEVVMDLSAHNIDVEYELEEAIASEVAFEIVAEHLNHLVKLSGKEENFTYVNRDSCKVSLNKMSIDIGKETRRGCGNKIVISPVMYEALDLSNDSNFVAAEPKFKISSLFYAGTLHKTMQVYVSTAIPENTILVGYKGGSGEVDAGYIYSPYVMLLSTGMVMNPDTFQPEMRLMTRYGLFIMEKSSSYYKSVQVTFTD